MVCRSGWSGATRTARSASIRTRRSPTPSAPSSSASPSWARSGASGSGSARRACASRSSGSPPSRSSGCRPATSPSITSSPTPATPAPTPTARRARNGIVDQTGAVRQRTRQLPRAEWAVLIPHHHPGFITWETYLANQERIGANTRPRPHQAGGAVREGAALLQGLAVCGRCGRRLRVSYHGRNATPAYYCSAGALVNGRGTACLRVGGQQIDAAVATTFLAACTPAGFQAALAAAERLEADHDAALTQRRQAVERARYEATACRTAVPRRRSRAPPGRTWARTGVGAALAGAGDGRSGRSPWTNSADRAG